MLKSMTGYGKAQAEINNVLITAEVKTLNSKYLELNLRLPKAYSDAEMEVRNLLSHLLVRGKANVVVEVQHLGQSSTHVDYNKELFAYYYSTLQQLADSVGASHDDLFRLALQQPEVAGSPVTEVGEEEWQLMHETIRMAVKQCDVFRAREGDALRMKLHGYASEISRLLQEVEKKDGERIASIRERLEKKMEELMSLEKLDRNRLEQEMFFYIEKLDISEEKVRLRTHLNYFEQTLKSADSNGKKLGFLGQEIGREINTIGSKANDATVQLLVVQMKEELEKIKEQSLNIL
ncbi:YicC/YloC family endoribonuclease [Cesiribacter andamanensis]|uniref:YicC-like family, N-terminal region n=1 Tax=Cesiribacter andamanensis AMV16 TaxID=1279009 RepID=M7NBI1_9BACT|nr:YicC/YloC family endoribonuclease [Cesiribacter andamanensis]EMR04551.1 hypothetical protein ADICEAN_00309 [Cesiribacter andamanensis AMV16]